ncbi:MAG: helix-turn-helix domain-containing protein [Anaerolineae bacterium]
MLKRLRLERGWTLEELSRAAKIPRTSLYMYETGRSQIPAQRLKALAKTFGVSLDYLVNGEDTPGQFAREHPEHFRLLTRAAKELPANRFHQLLKFLELYVERKGEIAGFDWQQLIEEHQDQLREADQ